MAITLPGNIRAKTSSPKLNFWLTLFIGCVFISAWTVIRFFNKAANFDQVGQLVLAQQWLHGQHSGSVIGPTNYILKIFFIYIPVSFIGLSAQLKLILLTVSINMASFVLISIGLRRIWGLLRDKSEDINGIPFIYLSLISGSVFWISFSNSRNLEVAGGVFLIYLFLKQSSQPSNRIYGWFVVLGSILFFADPLQIYMTLLPLLIFGGLRLLKQSKGRLLLMLSLCSGLSLITAKLITKLIEKTWTVSFIATNQSAGFQLSSIKLALEQMARLYSGGYEGGRIREGLNLLVVLIVVISAGWIGWRKKTSRQLILLAAIFWLVDLTVYIISGQAQQADTNRYLIMTVPAFVLAMAVVLNYFRSSKLLRYAVVIVLGLNILSLATAFTKAWDPSLAVNGHDRAAINYLKSHNYSYGYASINTALASDYLSSSRVNLLPLGCDPDYVLKKANLFFDKSGFTSSEQLKTTALMPLILDGNTITISPTTCEPDQISQQLGPWQSIDHLSDGSTVLIYYTQQFGKLRNF